MAQKFPKLDIIKPIEEIKNKIQPRIFRILTFIFNLFQDVFFFCPPKFELDYQILDL